MVIAGRRWGANVLARLVTIVSLAGIAGIVHAQEALVLDTYTCAEFLSDLGDRANSAKVRRSLMMIAWASGYAAARQKDAPASLEMIAATLGDVCRNSPAEKVVRAITGKIDEPASREGSRAPARAASSEPAAAARETAAASSQQPSAAPSAAAPAGRAFTAYASRDMEGGDYLKQRGISLDQCESLCRKDDRCRAYSYDMWNRYCFLKSSVNPLRLEPRNVTSIAGEASVTHDDREPVIQRRTQKAFPNEPYLQANARSYDDCSQRCLKDKRCEAFNFYLGSRKCNLIERPREYSTDWGADIGIKVQPGK